MSEARHRERGNYQLYAGRYKSFGGASWTNVLRNKGWLQSTDDVIGNYDGDNPYLMVRWDSQWPKGNSTTTGPIGQEAEDKPIGWIPSVVHPTAVYGALSAWDIDQYAAKLLAKANPNVSHLSLATFIGELKDWYPTGGLSSWKDSLKSIPQVLRGRVQDVIRRGSKAYVAHRWAVKPLLSDMAAMNKLADAIMRRLDWLEQLQEERELRRTLTLHRDTDHGAYGTAYQAESPYFATWVREQRISYQKVWGSVAYQLEDGFDLPDNTERDRYGRTALDRLALELATGLNGYEALKSVWELTPFSWLIDWFANVGDFIDAHNNRVPVHARRLCIMRKSYVKDTRKIVSKPEWLSWEGEYYGESMRKERHVVNLASLSPLQISFPFLEGSKWSILGALFGSRLRKSRG